jgi:hypothetical protein
MDGYIRLGWMVLGNETTQSVGLITVCCQSHLTDQNGNPLNGPLRGFDAKRYSIAADRLSNGMVAVLVVDRVGQLKIVPIVGCVSAPAPAPGS